ncbi:hypothetical protein I4U23_027474 [Adineta vaga]|nr:hypothetical protein I4U23_027474 [Adineta vaga]
MIEDGRNNIFISINNTVYVTDFKNHRILVWFQGDRQPTQMKIDGHNNPSSLFVTINGDIYVENGNNQRVNKWILSTKSNESISSQEITTSILQEKEITTVKATSLVEFLSLTSIETSITTKETLIEHFNLSFIPKQCNDTKYIGSICNISNNICITSNPCQNNGTCININNTNILHFNCSCLSGYNGTYCEFDHRLCKPYTCLNHGICNESSLTRFNCTCNDGWQGIHCESMINYCLFKNITCFNNGICRPLLLNYTCECLGNNYYSGRHCEIKSKKILIFKFISKSFSYIVIIALIIVVMFIVIMDILKYCFGIDPVDEERQRIRRQKQITKRKRINIALQSQSTNIPRITVTKVTV